MDKPLTEEEIINNIGCILNGCCNNPFTYDQVKEFVVLYKNLLVYALIPMEDRQVASSFKNLITVLKAYDCVDCKDCFEEFYHAIFDELKHEFFELTCILMDDLRREEGDIG